MEINLDALAQMHPRLELSKEFVVYERRAKLALSRSQHESGVVMHVDHGGTADSASLRWTTPDDPVATLDVIDTLRVTEDGAEGVALAFVFTVSGWTVRRRMQRNSSADWLMEDAKGARKMALEISGSIEGDLRARLREKLDQVARATEERNVVRAAVVVGFAEPRLLASTVERGTL